MVLNGTHFNQAFNMGGWKGIIYAALRAMIITGKTIWDPKIISDQWEKQKNEYKDMVKSLFENLILLQKKQGYSQPFRCFNSINFGFFLE